MAAVDTAPARGRAATSWGAATSRGEKLLLLGLLGALVTITVPEVGSDPTAYRTGPVKAGGVLAPVVRAASNEWHLGFIRSAAILAGVVVAAAALWTLWSRRDWRPRVPVALTVAVACLLLLPAVLLQVGLRDGTEPWFYVNDSTYQIEIAGELLLDGKNPYGYDYNGTGLERWYSFDGSIQRENVENQVALRHFAYFPGTPVTAAVWNLLPEPLDDYRLFVALTALLAIPACLLFPGPLWLRLCAGVLLAAGPLTVRATWFGTADAPSVLLLLLAFAMLLRSRWAAAGALLAGAILLKQFAIVAVPFIALAMFLRAPRDQLKRAAGAFALVLAAGFGPFLIADAGALFADTITYGGDTYRIIGYGLAGWLLEIGVIEERTDAYPFFLLATLVWAPATLFLLDAQRRTPALWMAAAAFSVSVFILFFVGRVFQTSYLVWPFAGSIVALLLAVSEGWISALRAPGSRA